MFDFRRGGGAPSVRRTDWRLAPGWMPRGERLYAIGDIHGRADLLRVLLDAVDEDVRGTDSATLVLLGDYVDRGPDSSHVIDALLGARPALSRTVPLLGNHEASFLQFMEDARLGPSWLHYGGRETLASYGVRAASGGESPARLAALQAALAEALPPAHLSFLEALAPSYEAGGYLFVHAGIRPGIPLAEQSLDELLWIRDAFLRSTADHGRVVVHGHTIVQEPEVRSNRIGIDTGAFATGVLTCLVLEADRYRVIQTEPA